MDKIAAQTLVQKTLQDSFNKERFVILIKNILNHIEEVPLTYQDNDTFDDFIGSIQRVDRVGGYKGPDEKFVDILIVHLQNETLLERARTTQRNFVANYLRSHGLKDAALVAFVTPNGSDWRFSFVKMAYKFNEKGKVEEKFTPARRYSFLVGKNEKSHTAQSRLLPVLLDDEVNPTLEDLEEVFSVEKVTKEFFEKYRDLFLRLKEALDKVVNEDAKVKADFKKKNIDTADFSKKLLGQIVFLYFLQKKGWLGVKRDEEWGSGSRHFLRDLFAKNHGGYKNFFNDILEPLFYEALRLEWPGDYYEHFDCRIPFLNGGLFDPLYDYDWVETDILLPDELFSNDRRTKEGDTGNGILDIFDRYNFTVKEDEPLEKEVAVDPEMLGQVFENLLEIKDRKSKGTYYTPREIVHYMCQESLVNYLATELEGKVSKKDIETLIKYGETVVEHDSHVASKEGTETFIKHGETVVEDDSRVASTGHKTKTYPPNLPESIRKHAELIDEKLASIRVCDPAVGSGAFPVGMMNEIIRTRSALTPDIGNDGQRTLYQFKREAIQNCLYGVDIDPGAVEIAKLRLWLSLIVDEDESDNIQPLPNLDYKIMQGNSLLSVKWDLLNHGLSEFKNIKPLKLRYFNETSASKKQKYKNQIDEIISQITDGHKDFDFKVYFSEVFHEKGGFDVVIGNPPYVRADSGLEYLSFRKKLNESKTYETLYEKWDLMVPFIERGLNIANPKGDLIYIVSNAICTSKYAFKLLDLIQKEYFTHSIDYFENMAVFEAGVVPVVLHVGKTDGNGKTNKIVHRGSFENTVNVTEIVLEKFKSLGRDAFRKEYNPLALRIQTVSLGDVCYLSKGMVINADEKTIKGKFTKNDLISKTKTQIHSREYVEGKNINSYVIKQFRYLEWGTQRVPSQLSRQTFPELYDRQKVMRGRVTGGIYDNTGLLCNDSIVVFVRFVNLHEVNNKSIQMSIKKFNRIPRDQLERISEKFDLKYLLSILNSSFALKYLNNIRRHRLENYFYPDDFRRLPIADIPNKEQKPFIDIVDKILDITKADDYLENSAQQAKVREYEKQIDQLVYKLYDLTDQEVKIVENAQS